MSTKKRSYSVSNSAKKGRYSLLTGYDRSRGGVIGGGLQSRMKAAALMKERGYSDVALTSYGLSTGGAVALLNTVAQGAAITQRVGKKISLQSLQCRGVAFAGTAGTIADGTIMIVYDRRPTGSLPAVTDILDTASSASFNKDDNAQRFRILKRVDNVFIGNSTTPSTGAEAITADFFLNLKGLPTVYKSVGTGAIGDIEEGALYLVTVGSVAAGTTAATASLGFRIRFVDM